ncbi:MAG: bifunctional phosphopantothenoylcysteine decarboxylase/phosphopantothenate--cysteine ligase CoaBC [Desulfuromonas sp.]|nr:MAG: bifunctional phosphopantothenoylcysteine decarboxylase/phosphopantothenate--cysteine ligase CoaBC [Desulfuromonas sp.]
MLSGKTIVLGVTGGIAAYKSVELLRLLTKSGAAVHVIMTRSAAEFVGPLTFQTLSGNPVHTELFDLYQESEIGHISLADRADLVLVAPATANIIGKVANGIADDLLTTTIMATRSPVLFAPAMNVNMWENPLYRENQQKLEKYGYLFVEPDSGFLACGWDGKGKLPDPQLLFDRAAATLHPSDLVGEKVVVTAGPTREEIDPVRYISNYSSGRMGYAIAAAATQRGAEVVLVSGPTALTPPAGVELVRVESAAEMYQAVIDHSGSATIVVKAAAVADYRPIERASTKVKKGGKKDWTLAMEKNPDILAELGAMKKNWTLIGFAAETDDLLANARKKLEAKNLDIIVANDVTCAGAGFDVDTNLVRFLYRNGESEELPKMTKLEVAHTLFDRLAKSKKS